MLVGAVVVVGACGASDATSKTINGYVVEAGAELAGADLAGADLSGV